MTGELLVLEEVLLWKCISSVLGSSKTITLSATQLQALLAALSKDLELASSEGPVTISATSSIKEGDLS